jgi:hypothetical protein
MPVDGVARSWVGWQEWAITTRSDASAYWRTALKAVTCHRSQIGGYPNFDTLLEADQRSLWGVRSFYRAFSTVNGGRHIETDFFEGL